MLSIEDSSVESSFAERHFRTSLYSPLRKSYNPNFPMFQGVPWEVGSASTAPGNLSAKASTELRFPRSGGLGALGLSPVLSAGLQAGKKEGAAESASTQSVPRSARSLESAPGSLDPPLPIFAQHWSTLRSAFTTWIFSAGELAVSDRVDLSEPTHAGTLGGHPNNVASKLSLSKDERLKYSQCSPVGLPLLTALRKLADTFDPSHEFDGGSSSGPPAAPSPGSTLYDSAEGRLVLLDDTLFQLHRVFDMAGVELPELKSLSTNVLSTLLDLRAAYPEGFRLSNSLEGVYDLRKEVEARRSAVALAEFEADHAALIGCDATGSKLQALSQVEQLVLATGRLLDYFRGSGSFAVSSRQAAALTDGEGGQPSLRKRVEALLNALKPIERSLSAKYAATISDMDRVHEELSLLRGMREDSKLKEMDTKEKCSGKLHMLEHSWNAAADKIEEGLRELAELIVSRRKVHEEVVQAAVDSTQRIRSLESQQKLLESCLKELQSSKQTLSSAAELLMSTNNMLGFARSSLLDPAEVATDDMPSDWSHPGYRMATSLAGQSSSEQDKGKSSTKPSGSHPAQAQQRLKEAELTRREFTEACLKHRRMCAGLRAILDRYPPEANREALLGELQQREVQRETLVERLLSSRGSDLPPGQDPFLYQEDNYHDDGQPQRGGGDGHSPASVGEGADPPPAGMNSTQWETMKKVKATLQDKLDELRRAKREGRLASATDFQRDPNNQARPQQQAQPGPEGSPGTSTRSTRGFDIR